MKSWRAKEVGGAVAVLRSSRKRNSVSSSASSLSEARFQKLSPVLALRKARVFVSCLPALDVKAAARKRNLAIASLRRRNPSNNPNSKGEPQVVSAEIIQNLIVDFTKSWNVDRPGDQFNPTMTAHEWLAQETGIHIRRLGGYSRGEFKFVSYTHAEAIVLALGFSHRFATGEIEVMKNPNWSWWRYNDWLRSRGVDLNVL